MNHTKVNCSSCNKELMIRVAKGENAPDKVICQTCSTILPRDVKKQYFKMNLGEALKVAKGRKRVRRGCHRDVNFVLTGKQDRTAKQSAQINRIYGSD